MVITHSFPTIYNSCEGRVQPIVTAVYAGVIQKEHMGGLQHVISNIAHGTRSGKRPRWLTVTARRKRTAWVGGFFSQSRKDITKSQAPDLPVDTHQAELWQSPHCDLSTGKVPQVSNKGRKETMNHLNILLFAGMHSIPQSQCRGVADPKTNRLPKGRRFEIVY